MFACGIRWLSGAALLALWVPVPLPAVKVAVYEHETFSQPNAKEMLRRNDVIAVMKKNLDVYRAQARAAATQNAKMIVYPENGLYGGGLDRDSIYPYLEDIPAPQTGADFCPCKNASVDQTALYIQQQLSCIALDNQIYVAATAADKKDCAGDFAKNCPKDDKWHFNTAVVYDPKGCLVARYHKQHLYFEEAFDVPPKAEISTFQTPFGKFGLLICFDLLYKAPAIDLVEKHGVESIILPTSWVDSLPLLSGIGFHSAWAAGMKVNLLASNRFLPTIRMSGSGIYTAQGALAYTCRNESESVRLLIAELPDSKRLLPPVVPTPLNISLGDLIRRVEAPHFTFKSMVFHDHFKFILMRERVGLKKVCEHNFCCYLRYEMEHYLEDELYAFGAFWGKHTFQGTYYIQVCAVVRCRLGDLHSTCGEAITYTQTRFKSLYIDGTFNSTYVFPVVLTSNMTLPEVGDVQFAKYPYPFLESKSGFARPLISAGLVARLYDKDSGAVALTATPRLLGCTLLILSTSRLW